MPHAIARGLCCFLALFTLLNLAGEVLSPGFDASEWWIDLRPLPAGVSRTLLAMAAALMLAHAFRPGNSGWRGLATLSAVVILLGACLCNIGMYFLLLWRGHIATSFPVPFSLLIAVALAVILRSLLHQAPPPRRSWLARTAFAATLPACAILLPLAQMACFGRTDYRRPADAIVVFGARAYADGRPSDALADRVRTACALYHEGYARTLVLSGGPGDGPVHETESMRRFAMTLGVRDQDILLDPDGLNTAATAANTVPLVRARGLQRILAVSHFYHLPRVKMAYRRTGQDVFTVPARETYTLRRMPWLILREVAALWAYYITIGTTHPMK